MTEARVVGSVATLELRRNLAIAYAKLDRYRAEQTKNEAMKLTCPRRHASVPLAFADHMDRFVLFWIGSTARRGPLSYFNRVAPVGIG
jgi:hypothetical protein